MIDRPELLAAYNRRMKVSPQLGELAAANFVLPTFDMGQLGEPIIPEQVLIGLQAGIGTTTLTTGDQLEGDFSVQLMANAFDSAGASRYILHIFWINADGGTAIDYPLEIDSNTNPFQFRIKTHLYANWEFRISMQMILATQTGHSLMAWNRL